MKKATIILISVLAVIHVKAQSGLDKILSEVERNNKSIAAEKQYLEAQKLSFKTGLNPENPRIEYDRLPGSPEGAGTQQDFSVTQPFDFPTSYGKRRVVSGEQITQAELQVSVFRQQLLLDAKLAGIEYIYRTKLQKELVKRERINSAL